jgi:hypothetical protein
LAPKAFLSLEVYIRMNGGAMTHGTERWGRYSKRNGPGKWSYVDVDMFTGPGYAYIPRIAAHRIPVPRVFRIIKQNSDDDVSILFSSDHQ